MTIQPERSGGAVTALFLSEEEGTDAFSSGSLCFAQFAPCHDSREGGRERAREGDTKWAPLRSLPLCLCYAGSSSHGTSLAYLLGLTFPRCSWCSTLRFLFRPERLLRLLPISSNQRFLPFLEILLRLLTVFGTWRRRRVIVQIVRFECTFRFSRQEEERGIRV